MSIKKILMGALIIMMVISSIMAIFTSYIIPENIETVTYTWGSEGDVVKEIQTKLKQWGYYEGSIDGKYGYETWKAVREFQEKNGIQVDGIAGSVTLNKMGINVNTSSTSKIYSWGARGETVREIQRRLKNWGYYDGYVDGIYGYKTWLAVRSFQSKNGLQVDGVVGSATLNALGIPTGESSTTVDQNVYLIAAAIHGEARGEPYIGQVAVGAVILNRVRHSSFPNSIAGVIYQPGAFDAVSDGQINLTPDETAYKAAKDAINGWDPTGGAIYYWNPATATSEWIWSRTIIKQIGKHVFAK
ncbi:spore cortex-lytic enzyme [Defluviitalea phaphyphila]|uniref:spore cortex-lytic enzyme n=1 Tax=Defluviitalea phaphyphila TaxID=1473580 RepID=UPI00072FBF47|nr:spore cortex-lytic enzyme [Defluviitalea phaphyphila]